MKRGVLYGRYSTDLQNEESVDDQFRLCRKFVSGKGIEIVGTYEDRGISGATIAARLGVQKLMKAAERKEFEYLIVESLSRLSRAMRDMNFIADRLKFYGIEIWAVNSGGRVDTIQVGVQGLVAQMQREETAKMVKRGMEPKAAIGKSMGGRAFGYHVPELAEDVFHTGKLEVYEPEAKTIRRIFDEFISGKTPRQIAYGLNEDKIPPPRGAQWNASTINGNGQRGCGILRNEKYIGRLVWNKNRMVLDDRMGKRISRVNGQDERVVGEGTVPAIVSVQVFEKAQTIIEGKARVQAMNGFTRAPKRLLSGKLQCGVCGGGMSSLGKDRSGRTRIRCTNHAESGTCPDPKTHYLDTIEQEVLALLQVALQRPERVRKFVDEYQKERRRLMGESISERSKVERRLGELHRRIDHATGMMLDGHGDQRVLDKKIKEAAAERDQLEARLEALEEQAPDLKIEPHPTLIKRHLDILGRLQPILEQGAHADDPDLMIIRELVEHVIVKPDKTLKIVGRLDALTGAFQGLGAAPTEGVWGAMVAEEGFEPPTQGL
ncbi:recombinase family protein [Microvirga aerophila]|uniref:Recombinase n=1 Tax=Microvirga aerophila TaxID=670291 RepID=A0A512BW49_9HYPH|nr:recombinase [Microvirga aerophila]